MMKIDISDVIAIMTVISLWLMWLLDRLSKREGKFRPRMNPVDTHAAQKNKLRKDSNKYRRLRSVFFFIVLGSLLTLLCFEISSPEELTRSAVYKIVFCVSGFFSLLLYETIIQTTNSQARLTADVADLIVASHPPAGRIEGSDQKSEKFG